MKQNLCRVCLENVTEKHENKVISVFEKYNNKKICIKINEVVCVNIKEGDGLPDKICLSCVQSLEIAYEFRQKCKHSDNILRSSVQTDEKFVQVPVKEEPLNDKHICAEENESDDVKHEYEDVESDGANECEEYLLSEQSTHQENSIFKSRAIDLHLECDDCGQFFRSKCKLRVHWKKEHMRSQLTCPRCKKVCSSYKNFHTHMKKKSKFCLFSHNIRIEGEGRSRIYHCTQCEYKTNKIDSIKVHWRIHSGERPFSCNICNKLFNQSSSLIRHREGVHKLETKEGVCKHCGKCIQGRDNLYRHMRTHTARYPCNQCGKILKSKGSLDVHMKRHIGIKSFTCEICAKMFIGTSDLSNHKASVHLKTRSYKCDKCAYTVPVHTTMSKHKKRHTDTNIPCITCGRFVDNELQLKVHQERHIKNFDCEHCSKSFHSWKSLGNHIRKQHNMRRADTSQRLK